MLTTHELPAGHDLRPQKLSGHDTPHATIEVNSECNIRCRHCYNIDRGATKTLAQIEEEIDLLLSRRRLDTVSLVGGEPTIHPRIVEIVSAVKRRGLICQVLTNGVAFLEDGEDRLLGRMVEAGVDRFLVHIDDGQEHVHGDIDAARHRLFARLEQQRVCFGLTLTLKRGDEGTLPRLVRELGRYRYFDGFFVTMAMDVATAFDPERSTAADPDLGEVHRSLARDLGLRPAGYLPSSLDDDAICWLMYFHYVNVDSGRTFPISPRFSRGFRRVHRWLVGREFFGATSSPRWLPAWLTVTAAVELVLAPARLAELLALLRRGRGGLRFHYIVVQQLPRFNPRHGRVELCYQCPDATARDGRLTPTCVASWLSPADGSQPRAPRAAALEIYDHLGEAPPTPASTKRRGPRVHLALHGGQP